MSGAVPYSAAALLLAAGLLSGFAGCGRQPAVASAPDPVRPLRFVRLRWPGRPVSDRMDREVFARREVRDLASRIGLDVFDVDEAPAELRELLPGIGTLALRAGDRAVVGVSRGAVSAPAWRNFVERARRDGPRLGALRSGQPGDDGRRERAELALGLGLVDEAADCVAGLADALGLHLRVHEARGDVAAMRAAFDAASPAQRDIALEVLVLLAERRPSDAAALLQEVPAAGRDARWSVLDARVSHDRGETRAAAARLTALIDSAADQAIRDEARDLLARWWFDETGTAHRHEAAPGPSESR